MLVTDALLPDEVERGVVEEALWVTAGGPDIRNMMLMMLNRPLGGISFRQSKSKRKSLVLGIFPR
jgi:hypothetical protein